MMHMNPTILFIINFINIYINKKAFFDVMKDLQKARNIIQQIILNYDDKSKKNLKNLFIIFFF